MDIFQYLLLSHSLLLWNFTSSHRNLILPLSCEILNSLIIRPAGTVSKPFFLLPKINIHIPDSPIISWRYLSHWSSIDISSVSIWGNGLRTKYSLIFLYLLDYTSSRAHLSHWNQRLIRTRNNSVVLFCEFLDREKQNWLTLCSVQISI